MDKRVASILLRSLIGRIERDPETGRYKLAGALSDLDLQALELAAAWLETSEEAGTAPVPAASTPAPSSTRSNQSQETRAPEAPVPERRLSPTRKPPPRLKIDEKRRAVEDPNLTLCLDFGTAKSKAFATTQGEGSGVEYIALGLGQQAGEAFPFPLTSAVWIDDSERVFVGEEALKRSLSQWDRKRKRLDSLKQQVSQGDEHRLGAPLDEQENPSSTRLTYGDMLTLYLAFLTDMAETELSTKGYSRYVRRRFALPCWSADQFESKQQLVRDHLARAQLVADTLRGEKWWKEGLPVAHVRALMDEVTAARTDWPMNLISDYILEPVAAGNGRLQTDKATRQLVLVIDVGAGTTDFALFLVDERPDDDFFRLSLIDKTTDNLRQAGDTVDQILRQHILDDAGLDKNDSSYGLINAQLQLWIRDYKERLFRDGQVTYSLSSDQGGSIKLNSFLSNDKLLKLQNQIEQKCHQTLEAAGEDKVKYYNQRLRVVLTGGSSALPMFAQIAKGHSEHFRHTLRRTPAPIIPDNLKGQAIEGVYPQLAVAFGGALPEIPKMGKPVGVVKGLSTPKWHVAPGWIGKR